MESISDLDALIPVPHAILWHGQEVSVKSPRTVDVLQIGQLARQLGDSDASEEVLAAAEVKLLAVLKRCIPELADAELNLAQINKLVGILQEMALPTERKELEAKGVTVDSSKKAP